MLLLDVSKHLGATRGQVGRRIYAETSRWLARLGCCCDEAVGPQREQAVEASSCLSCLMLTLLHMKKRLCRENLKA